MNRKRLFDEKDNYTDQALDLEFELIEATKSIVSKYHNADLRDITLIIANAAHASALEILLDRKS